MLMRLRPCSLIIIILIVIIFFIIQNSGIFVYSPTNPNKYKNGLKVELHLANGCDISKFLKVTDAGGISDLYIYGYALHNFAGRISLKLEIYIHNENKKVLSSYPVNLSMIPSNKKCYFLIYAGDLPVSYSDNALSYSIKKIYSKTGLRINTEF